MTDQQQPWQKPLTDYERGVLTRAPIDQRDLVSTLTGELSEALNVLKMIVSIHPELLKDSRLARTPSEGCAYYVRSNRIEDLLGTEIATWVSKEEPAVIKHHPSKAEQTLDAVRELKDRQSAQCFEVAITAPDFSHISTRSNFGGYANSYRSDNTSPSGVLSSGSIDMNNRYYQALLQHHRKTAHHGPQRGDMALRKQGY